MTKVLVVEDNPINMELVLEILNVMGFTAWGAKDGKEAIEMAGTESYDLIIMDIELPGMNGIKIKNIIKSQHGHENAPVIALTAYAMKGDKERFLGEGFDEYIPKPIDLTDFMQRMEKYKKVFGAGQT